ncbi:efflux RND transporter periplasmic adaptor subunit [Photobacterium minamisatsumaniensis]|uniref:efflux RND transporter periplasmic adaptor subunit n=1 Tax=Photobacterium minamisatsumaniensis TaxID=2910233 RepID=UPI003D105C88
MKYQTSFLMLSLSLGLLALTGCDTKDEPQSSENLRPVRIAEVSTNPADFQHRFAGTTASSSTTNLSFQVTGTIESFPAKAGTLLASGDVIATLNDDDLQLTLAQNKALLEQALMSAQASTSRYKRIANLHEKHLVSDMDYDASKAEYQVNLAKVDQAQRAVDLSKQQISYTTLHAQGSHCSVTEAHATENENVSSGQTIAVMSCGDEIEVVANVSETSVSSLKIGQDISAVIHAINSSPIPATISEIGLNSSSSGTYFITATLASENRLLRPGMAAELLINRSISYGDNSLWIPMNAVNEQNGQHYVMIYQPLENGIGTVKKQPVNTGKFIAGSIEITNGLLLGQQIITAGLSQIYDGLNVTALNEGND